MFKTIIAVKPFPQLLCTSSLMHIYCFCIIPSGEYVHVYPFQINGIFHKTTYTKFRMVLVYIEGSQVIISKSRNINLETHLRLHMSQDLTGGTFWQQKSIVRFLQRTKDLAIVNNYRKFEEIIFTNNKDMSV